MYVTAVKIHEVELVTVNKRLLPETSTSASPPTKKIKKANEAKMDVRKEKKESDKRLLDALRDGQEVARTKWQQEKYVLGTKSSLQTSCNKHDLTLQTIHTRKSEWKVSFIQ